MDYKKNISYIFIPFSYNKFDDWSANFQLFVDELKQSGVWKKDNTEIKYMLKYVADKINSNDEKNCQCFHYLLNDKCREQFGLGNKDDWFYDVVEYCDNKNEKVRFKILDVHFYCFSTTVGIIAFQLNFENDEPIWISNAQYYLKKVSKEMISIDGYDNMTTLLDISKNLVSEFSSCLDFDFFYYANPNTERANILTYIEVGPKDNYDEELFYLRRCYGTGFDYPEDKELASQEKYVASKAVIWGISSEAAACLACPDDAPEGFVQNKFYINFNQQYLFMYVLLLHQKYVLYLFLSQIGVGTNNDLETLERYRHNLYEFETDFVFSCITEVAQYQNLYERMSQAFSLNNMYKDVYEPLNSLRELQRETAENNQKRRDDSVNRALLFLSVLSFFSALIDSFDFVDSFLGWFSAGIVIKVVQCVCIAIIFSILIYVLVSLFKSKKGK